MLSPLDCLPAKAGGAVNGCAYAPFILTVDWLGWVCYLPDKLEFILSYHVLPSYSVKTGRLNTAVSGVSQGATTSLATGFRWQSKIAYIASLAPDPGVIPTPYYAGTYWNWPIFDDFTIESPETMPR